MNVFTNEYINYLESLITIFTVDKGIVKVLLLRKKEEPYKGYWILPGNALKNSETLEDNITDAVLDQTGLLNVYLEQCYTFSSLTRSSNDFRVLATSFIGIVDSISSVIKREARPNIVSEWFPINDIPKMAYDHEEVIKRNIEYLRKKIVNSSVLKGLFPSDFTLPEIQKVYEQVLGKNFDRRNFRKKFISMGLIEDTNEKNIGCNGRPAKLYKFKDNIKQIDLF